MAVWAVVDKLTNSVKVPPSLRSEALEAVLYFAERDAVAMRQAAVARAKTFLRRSMPYTLHATVALFESILSRVDGNITQSESVISDFYYRGPRPVTRRDHALRGRLHISEIENKIKSWNEDDDIPSFIYKWAAEQPLSALDTEVTFRLQSTAARFFQSVGDFPAARASLEHIISLDGTKPIRLNSRRLLAGRLSDVYCEMQQYDKVMEVLQPELDLIQDSDRPRRGFRRLMLAWVEAKIGMGDLTAAEALLEETGKADPLILDDVYNQQLHMRRLFAAARVAHMRSDLEEAVSRWQYALEEVEKLRTLKSKNGFTASVAYLSLAHAQLGTGDLDGARHSWSAGMKILGSEKCEFWIPVAPTLWLGRIAAEVYKSQGWSFRMMLPGGRGDLIFG
jgi:tetratricopeptide (TPR) repeat protein